MRRNPSDDQSEISPFIPLGVAAGLISMRLKEDRENAAQSAVEGVNWPRSQVAR